MKTSAPIPKAKIVDCLEAIRQATLKLPVAIGDVVVPKVLGLNADVVATRNLG